MLHALGSDVVARLAAARPSFTLKMPGLAAFVANHYVQVAFMNTRELAAAASEAGIYVAAGGQPVRAEEMVLAWDDGRPDGPSPLPGVRR